MFTRCLLCLDVGQEPRPAAEALLRTLGRQQALHVYAVLAGPARHWIHDLLDPQSQQLPNWSLAALTREAAFAGDRVTAEVAWELDVDALEAAAAALGAECVAFGATRHRLPRRISQLAAIAEGCRLPVLWLGTLPPRGGGRRYLVPYEREVRLAARSVAALRGKVRPQDRVVLLALGRPDPQLANPALLREIADLRCELASEALAADLPSLSERLDAHLSEQPVDLVVLAPEALSPVTALAARWFGQDALTDGDPALLILPPDPEVASLPGELDAPDVVRVGNAARLAAARRGLLGLLPLDEPLRVVAHGRSLGRVELEVDPRIELPSDRPASVLGLGRETTGSEDPLTGVEALVTVVDPSAHVLVLLDAHLPADSIAAALEASRGSDARCALVRLRPEVPCASIRDRLGSTRLPVLDANLLLAAGSADDAPAEALALQLSRAADRLRAAGARVAAIVPSAQPTPLPPRGYAVLTPDSLSELPEAIAAASTGAPAPPDPLDALTGSRVVAGNRVHVELDNRQARRRLLGLVASTRERLHLQTYIVHDDAFTRELGDALGEAAGRGVRVRVLADSLYSRHDSFGQRNPWLERMSGVSGVEVRVHRPLASLPNLLDLKLRNHRKLVAFDGQVALVSGRNLASTYFTGFDEVALDRRTEWEQVPWLDSGAFLAGPLVADVERAFLSSWTAAGGEAFPVVTPGPAGSIDARLVLHDGLRDAHTLDAYLALIRSARAHVTLVNAFPLAQEVEHALLEASRAGVRIRAIIGNIRPKHGAEPTPFPAASSVRELGDQLVRGHLDALVSAGAEVFELTLEGLPGWAQELGPVRPHVHAKLLSVDGRRCTVGSANLDVTSSYWESEALLVVEDELIARKLDVELDALAARSRLVTAEDAAWREGAPRRAWLRRHWPRVIG